MALESVVCLPRVAHARGRSRLSCLFNTVSRIAPSSAARVSPEFRVAMKQMVSKQTHEKLPRFFARSMPSGQVVTLNFRSGNGQSNGSLQNVVLVETVGSKTG